MLERCAELLRQAGKTAADIFGDTGFGAATAQMAALGVPHALHADADALRASTVQLAEVAHELAVAELAGLKKEGKVTQRFRAPQTLAVLNAAAALLKDVDAWATPVASVDEEHAAELRRGLRRWARWASAAAGRPRTTSWMMRFRRDDILKGEGGRRPSQHEERGGCRRNVRLRRSVGGAITSAGARRAPPASRTRGI